MKILQINYCYGYASTGRIVMELAEALDKQGNDCRVAYSVGINTRPKDIVFGNILDRKIHALMSRIFGLQGYFSFIATLLLIRKIDKFKPDIVHLHNLHSNNLNYKLLYNYLIRKHISTVMTLHDCFPFTARCCHYTLDNCYQWENGCKHCPRLAKDNPSLFFDKTTKIYKDKKKQYAQLTNLTIIGVSNWIVNEAKNSSLFTTVKKFERIYNWIDLAQFCLKENIDKSKYSVANKFVIICVATIWSEAKGLNQIIELSTKLNDDEVILMVGNIKNSINLPNNVIYKSSTNNVEELVDYYNIADVFVSFSIEETFGKVTAEACACGIPVVVMNSTANPELVGENCGYINNSFTVDETYNHIKTIKKNGKSFYSEHCRNFVCKNFDKDKLINEHIKLYKEVN